MSWPVLARAELVLLARSPLALVNAVLMPIALGAGWLWLAHDTGRDTGGDAAAIQVLMVLGFTPYAGATTVLAARRHELVLKRLRGSGLSSPGIIAGLLTPYAVLVLVQAGLLIATTVVAGDPPVRWWPLLLALVGGTVLAMAFAVATAAVTAVPELAQLTTAPIFLSLFGGGLWLVREGEPTWVMRLLPGASIADLCRWAWREPGTPAGDVLSRVAPSVLAMAVAAAVAIALATAVFRWEPRRA